MKKAQTEIIGLMVIVILFIFVGLIYIVFTSGERAEPMRDVEQQIIVTNILDSYLQLTPCDERVPMDQMSDIIKDCYISGSEVCGFECKEYIETVIKDFMTAYKPKQEYKFEIKDSKTTWLGPVPEKSCENPNRITPDTSFITASGTRLEAKLTFCS